MGSLGRLLDVCIDEKRIRLRVDVLHHDLESIETPSFGDLDLSAKSLDEILIDNAIRCGEEGEDVGNKPLLVVIESVVPIMEVLGQVNLLGSPEGSLVLLVHLPDLNDVLEHSRDYVTRDRRDATRTS